MSHVEAQRQTPQEPRDNLARVREAIEDLKAISSSDPAKRPPPGVYDGPLVRAARRLERLLGISA
jgi:hypothetical protein